MALLVLAMKKIRPGMASLGSASGRKVASQARFVCALNLQSLKSML